MGGVFGGGFAEVAGGSVAAGIMFFFHQHVERAVGGEEADGLAGIDAFLAAGAMFFAVFAELEIAGEFDDFTGDGGDCAGAGLAVDAGGDGGLGPGVAFGSDRSHGLFVGGIADGSHGGIQRTGGGFLGAVLGQGEAGGGECDERECDDFHEYVSFKA